MAIFAKYAGISSQPLSKTYTSCAQQIDAGCGAGFVDPTVEVVASGAAMGPIGSTIVVSVVALAAAVFAMA
jgi:hypothetical protein